MSNPSFNGRLRFATMMLGTMGCLATAPMVSTSPTSVGVQTTSNVPGGASTERVNQNEEQCTGPSDGFHAAGFGGLGQWSYGWSAQLTAPFSVYDSEQPLGIAGGEDLLYRRRVNATHPVAFFNPMNTGRVLAGVINVQPNQLAMHPGPSGEYSVARWRALQAGSYRVEVTFLPIQSGVTTTDVHVLHNGGIAASGGLNLPGSRDTFRFSGVVNASAGDTIDFAVGFGNGQYNSDSTGVDAKICTVLKTR